VAKKPPEEPAPLTLDQLVNAVVLDPNASFEDLAVATMRFALHRAVVDPASASVGQLASLVEGAGRALAATRDKQGNGGASAAELQKWLINQDEPPPGSSKG